MPLLDPNMSPTCAKWVTGETAIAEYESTSFWLSSFSTHNALGLEAQARSEASRSAEARIRCYWSTFFFGMFVIRKVIQHNVCIVLVTAIGVSLCVS